MEKYPNINILLNLPRDYIPKAEFVLRTYCYILRLSPKFIYGNHFEAAHIYYGESTDQDYPLRIHFEPTAADFFESDQLYPLEKVNFCRFKEDWVPFLFSLGGGIFSFTPDACILRKDIIASGFYFLTCWHEYVFSLRGLEGGRVDYKESLQARWDFTELPVVDVYTNILHHVMRDYLPEFVRNTAWRENHPFALSLSHDIDYWDFWDEATQKSTLDYNLKSFRQRPLRSIYKIAGHLLHKKLCKGHKEQIARLLRKERELGQRSTWFILAKSDFEDKRQNYIQDLAVQVKLSLQLGAEEIGLHGSAEAAFDIAVLKREMQVLQELGISVKGFRTHHLHFDYQKSFSILEEAGIEYDSTLGYWEHIGFRAGTSYPFYPFNIRENRPFRVLEIPLIVMDTTLHSAKAMGLSPLGGRRTLKRLLKVAENYQSHISILWHNNTFDPIDYPGWGALYWWLIRRALKKDAWVCTLRDVWEEWVSISY
ncbi:MAG: polysaccharide deacetylase family protein [Candidatus Cloacimonadaceae bacterium]